MSDLLIEIGCEEIPARMIDAAREEFAKRIGSLLEREKFAVTAQVEAFSTPRRLAVLVHDVAAKQPDIEEQLVGPATKVAYKEGKPTAAAEAFARKAGVEAAQLQTITNPKGEYIAANVKRAGRTLQEILAEQLSNELNGLYWAKNMYWRPGKPERFVRPVRWIVALLDSEPLGVEYAGVKSGPRSRGHRLLSPADLTISRAAAYAVELEQAKVIADAKAREHRIRKALDAATRTVVGARWREDAELLNTVVNLTEFPGVLLGSFDPAFLSLPEEVLVTVMRDHQKYFAVEDASGKLAPHFLAVLNTEGDTNGVIRHGNERVLRARFNDAQFFWNADQKIPVEARIEMLRSVTFQKDLGSYHAKAARMTRIATELGRALNDRGAVCFQEAVTRAARLAKTDLTTELVKEFTELQGIVGGLYALAQGDAPIVAKAVYDQYRPESMDDSVPRSIEGALVSIADKADSITGMFALGLIPSGSKDPFALRRQANGIVRIVAEHRLPITISQITTAALNEYRAAAELKDKLKEVEKAPEALAAFFRERLEFYLRDARGFAYDLVTAVLSAGSDDVVDAINRAEAVAKIRATEDFLAISSAFKRMKNILRQGRDAKRTWPDDYSPEKLTQPEEQALGKAVAEARANVQSFASTGQYDEALAIIGRLRPVVDTFFDKVMVMVEDESLRANRLALLDTIVRSFSTIADFSEIVVA
jgi:glycyl-tRNA synthetase beta chain